MLNTSKGKGERQREGGLGRLQDLCKSLHLPSNSECFREGVRVLQVPFRCPVKEKLK